VLGVQGDPRGGDLAGAAEVFPQSGGCRAERTGVAVMVLVGSPQELRFRLWVLYRKPIEVQRMRLVGGA